MLMNLVLSRAINENAIDDLGYLSPLSSLVILCIQEASLVTKSIENQHVVQAEAIVQFMIHGHRYSI